MHFFYLIQADQNCKIGVTNNLKNRLQSIQTGSDQKLEYIKTWQFSKAVTVNYIEDEIKKYLLPYHLRGEWYSLESKEIIKIIDHTILVEKENIANLESKGVNKKRNEKIYDLRVNLKFYKETDKYWITRKSMSLNEKKITWKKYNLGTPPEGYDDWFIVGGIYNEEPIAYLPVKIYD